MSQNQLAVVVLAAGKGTRMKSSLPKVMHQISFRPMLYLVLDQVAKLSPKTIILVCSQHLLTYQQQILSEFNYLPLKFVLQEEQLGTAHAVSCALPIIAKDQSKDKSQGQLKQVLVLYADTPLITSTTLILMLQKLNSASIVVLSFHQNTPHQYGRIITQQEKVLQIIEHKDCTTYQQEITLSNSGVMAIDANLLSSLIVKVNNNNKAGEYYLTDLIFIANQQNLICQHLPVAKEEVLGVNSRLELAIVEKIHQKQIKSILQENGVTILMPKNTYIAYNAKISSDVILYPFVVIGKNVIIESQVEIKSFSHLEGVLIKSQATIGPFARIRPNSTIENKVKIGNFVEIKNSIINQESQINHLSYVGDAVIGNKTNIGAGVITCNYDGYQKSITTIGDQVFVGSNSCLIAPVAIENNTLIAAGSIITKNVPKDNLAIARSKQTNIKNGAVAYHHKKNINKKSK
jgi:bifunctional UDP-N-acetylglucosamine pyrophosphorylase/glucosamine-1-phosphate N-acetyltransferase